MFFLFPFNLSRPANGAQRTVYWGHIHMVLFTIAHRILLGYKNKWISAEAIRTVPSKATMQISTCPWALPWKKPAICWEERVELEDSNDEEFLLTWLLCSQTVCNQAESVVGHLVIKDRLTHLGWEVYLTGSVWGKTELVLGWRVGRDRKLQKIHLLNFDSIF